MIDFINSVGNRTTHRGVYCAWVPLHNDGNAPLISIWIDSAMAAFEPGFGNDNIDLAGIADEAIAEEVEDWEKNSMRKQRAGERILRFQPSLRAVSQCICRVTPARWFKPSADRLPAQSRRPPTPARQESAVAGLNDIPSWSPELGPDPPPSSVWCR
jgi:hypothetical protein